MDKEKMKKRKAMQYRLKHGITKSKIEKKKKLAEKHWYNFIHK